MRTAIVEFNQSIQSLITDRATYDFLTNQQHIPAAIVSDMLRYKIINIVSAMDRFFHEMVRLGMKQSINNPSIMTKQCENFAFRLSTVNNILRCKQIAQPMSEEEYDSYWINKELTERFKILSFQQTSKIKEALSYIWNENNKFLVISQNMSFPLVGTNDENKKKFLEETIDLIVDRRNQIAHEADIDPVTSVKRDIQKDWVENSVKLIIDFVYATYISITADTVFNRENY